MVPADAVVDLGGRRGVFTPLNESAVFRALQVGTEAGNIVEILGGLAEGDVVITTGAGALRDGDRIVLPGRGEGGRRGGTAGAGTGRGRGEGRAATAPPAPAAWSARRAPRVPGGAEAAEPGAMAAGPAKAAAVEKGATAPKAARPRRRKAPRRRQFRLGFVNCDL